MLKKKIKHKGRMLYVTLYGELQGKDVELLKKELLESMKQDIDKIIIDFAAVPYMDSAGIGMLVDIQKRASMKDVAVKLERLRDSVKVVLEYTGFLDLFEYDGERQNQGGV